MSYLAQCMCIRLKLRESCYFKYMMKLNMIQCEPATNVFYNDFLTVLTIFYLILKSVF